MFIKDDQDAIVRMINAKRNDAYLVPVYIRSYNDTFLLDELDQVVNLDQSGMHVGFGIKFSMFEKKQFPIELFEHFPCVTAFTRHDESINTDVKYFIFETGDPEKDSSDIKDKYQELYMQLTYYFNMLKDHLVQQHEENRKRKVAELMEEYM